MSSKKLLVKVKGDGAAMRAAMRNNLGVSHSDVVPIFTVAGTLPGPGMAPASPSTWLRIEAPDQIGWDSAHEVEQRAGEATQIEFIEPDIEQQWDWVTAPYVDGMAAAPRADHEQDTSGGQAAGPRIAWNLDDDFSQLKSARARVGAKQSRIRIAHLDTGYDPAHVTLPKNLLRELQANFADDRDQSDNAADPLPGLITFLNNHGHGTGTLSILAGNRVAINGSGMLAFDDLLGGVPLGQIIPIRIADSVVRFTTGTIVQGIDHALKHGAHVLSMSMGGVGSNALVDAVNAAYDQGLVMVTAAGNNFAGRPSPKSIVFPARFLRVIAACGLMADGRAYADLEAGTMQGNYGPKAKMVAALGAYTPNVSWARIGTRSGVRLNGAGTSSATPQIAAAAALWLAEHWDVVALFAEPWMRVEAVRKALFESASRTTKKMDASETREKIGQGVLRAMDALNIAPAAHLEKLSPAQASWSWLNLLFGSGGVSLVEKGPSARRLEQMLQLELTQMSQRNSTVADAVAEPERDTLSSAQSNRYFEAALDAGAPSKRLRAVLERHLGRAAGTSLTTVGTTGLSSAKLHTHNLASRVLRRHPPYRKLRVFALDPSLAKALDTFAINETTLHLPWNDPPDPPTPGKEPDPPTPGPVGEYLEVIDIDPASGKVYAPVDLHDKSLLAQDGLPPSEGNPQFHQQMVYAVAMTTIGYFEEALGRRAMWARHLAEHQGKLYSVFVPRLRIYPHALRTANAYYSPAKKALLFGYFKAESREADVTAPGTAVFTCLSSDIIAHETAHALLDGLNRGYQEASNPDVPAFHEAFSDVVALFQHFTIQELVRFAIDESRGDLSSSHLLAGLAKQFGEGTNVGGALRNYVSADTDRLRYADKGLAAHTRGAILVRAIYDAFIAIVRKRSVDLVRIATGGSGKLPDGALQPALVERLTMEATTTARHFLRICIRALDYCPCVDITFGDYLRALITADVDSVPDDPHGYRVAIMQSFRRRGIIPRDVLTMSTEALLWNVPAEVSADGSGERPDQPSWLQAFLQEADFGLDRRSTRLEDFKREQDNCRKLTKALHAYFRPMGADEREAAMRDFGLLPNIPLFDQKGVEKRAAPDSSTTFEVRGVRVSRRPTSDGRGKTDVIVVIQQRRRIPEKTAPGGSMWFRGGATLIIQQDLSPNSPAQLLAEASPDENDDHRDETPPPDRRRTWRIRYVVSKYSGSTRREETARNTVAFVGTSLRSLYFGDTTDEPFAMLHADAHIHGHGDDHA